MRKIAVVAIFWVLFSLLSPITAEAKSYVQATISVFSSACNETASGHSGNSSDFKVDSDLIYHQFTWYSRNSTHNNTATAGNLTIWADMGTGTWIKLSNGTTYYSDRIIVLFEKKSLNKIRIEMGKYFQNATTSTSWAEMAVKYRGWSY